MEISKLDEQVLSAVKSNNIDKVTHLLSSSSNSFNAENMTSAIHAINCQQQAMLQCLLDCGYNVNAINSHGRTMLHEAVICASTQCVQYLLQIPGSNLDLQDEHGWTPLFWAVNCGQRETVAQLLNLRCNVVLTDNEGNTILHRIAESGRLANFSSVLVDLGCDVNARNACNETPLMFAAVEGHSIVAETLLKLGADVDSVSSSKVSPLMYSVICGHVDTAFILINHNADLEICDSEGKFGQSIP